MYVNVVHYQMRLVPTTPLCGILTTRVVMHAGSLRKDGRIRQLKANTCGLGYRENINLFCSLKIGSNTDLTGLEIDLSQPSS